MGVRNDQADTAQPAADELAQELKPELMVLGRTNVDAHHLTLTVERTPTAIRTAIEITRPFSLTFSKVFSPSTTRP